VHSQQQHLAANGFWPLDFSVESLVLSRI
jgi:hypothetical protein